MAPVFLIGALILSSASLLREDPTSTGCGRRPPPRPRSRYQRSRGEVKLLLVRNLDVQLRRRAGAVRRRTSRSTKARSSRCSARTAPASRRCSKAISGLVAGDERRDRVRRPRHDVHAARTRSPARGVVQMPGGQGVFPTLSVAEHLRLAGWLHRNGHKRASRVDRARCSSCSRVLRDRMQRAAPATCRAASSRCWRSAMAFISKPRLLMIDELSLGLAPTIVEQLLHGRARDRRRRAPRHPRRAVGEPRAHHRGDRVLHGEGRDPLPRPDRTSCSSDPTCCARCSSKGAGASSPPRCRVRRRRSACHRARTATDRGATERGSAGRQRSRKRRSGCRSTTSANAFGGLSARRRCDVRRPPGEIVGFIGPNGAGKTTLFDAISGFPPADRARRPSRATASTSPSSRRRRALASASAVRSRTARLFPSLTVAETIAVALERHLEVRDPIAAALHLPSVADAEAKVRARVEELLELLGLTDFRDKLVTRAVDRAAGASSTSRACSRPRPVGPAARRAVVGNRHSARPRRSGRCSCASGTDRGDVARHRARRTAAPRPSPTA